MIFIIIGLQNSKLSGRVQYSFRIGLTLLHSIMLSMEYYLRLQQIQTLKIDEYLRRYV